MSALRPFTQYLAKFFVPCPILDKTKFDFLFKFPLIPASTMKLITTATALEVLGRDYQFMTSLAYDGYIDSNGLLMGNIHIIGSGDPTIGSKYFSEQANNTISLCYEGPLVILRFDEKGNSLQRTFLKSPLRFSNISSRYNLKRRIAYYGNRVKPHKGTDFAAPVGTPIMATADGRVVKSSYTRGNGYYVKIQHNNKYSTQYLHMQKNGRIKQGKYVKQGDVIGKVGMTGNTSGPHVCYRFWKNNRQVDPYKQKLPPGKPVPKKLNSNYEDYILPLIHELDQIK